MIDKHSQIRRIGNLFSRLIKDSTYGEVTVKLESGNIVYVEIDENQRLSTEEVNALVAKMQARGIEIKIRPTKGKQSQGISLITMVTKGSLEDVVPVKKVQ